VVISQWVFIKLNKTERTIRNEGCWPALQF
jgi:hypothetical protein